MELSSVNTNRRLVSADRLQRPNRRTKLLTPSVESAGIQAFVNYSDRVLHYARRFSASMHYSLLSTRIFTAVKACAKPGTPLARPALSYLDVRTSSLNRFNRQNVQITKSSSSNGDCWIVSWSKLGCVLKNSGSTNKVVELDSNANFNGLANGQAARSKRFHFWANSEVPVPDGNR
jgi:hypothetical protein